MTSLSLLKATVPNWVKEAKAKLAGLDIKACPQADSGLVGREYHLRIKTNGLQNIDVSEGRESKLLPKCCVERHINPGATFCLHYNSSKPLHTREEAKRWWQSLNSYLLHQDFAHRRRFWPLKAGLSHGDAALVQLEMERLAEPYGWKEGILASIFAGKGWLAGELPRRRKDAESLVNVRSPCPKGCTHKHGQYRRDSCVKNECVPNCRKLHKPILRADCPQRATVERLVLLEYRRRKIEHESISFLAKKGIQCCDTMNRCALRDLLK